MDLALPTGFDWNQVWDWIEGIEPTRAWFEPALVGASLIGRNDAEAIVKARIDAVRLAPARLADAEDLLTLGAWFRPLADRDEARQIALGQIPGWMREATRTPPDGKVGNIHIGQPFPCRRTQ